MLLGGAFVWFTLRSSDELVREKERAVIPDSGPGGEPANTTPSPQYVEEAVPAAMTAMMLSTQRMEKSWAKPYGSTRRPVQPSNPTGNNKEDPGSTPGFLTEPSSGDPLTSASPYL